MPRKERREAWEAVRDAFEAMLEEDNGRWFRREVMPDGEEFDPTRAADEGSFREQREVATDETDEQLTSRVEAEIDRALGDAIEWAQILDRKGYAGDATYLRDQCLAALGR